MGSIEGPNSKVSGPKYYNINGIWVPIPHYLGLWALRVARRQSKATVSMQANGA